MHQQPQNQLDSVARASPVLEPSLMDMRSLFMPSVHGNNNTPKVTDLTLNPELPHSLQKPWGLRDM